MNNNSGLANGLWENFINFLFKSSGISVPSDFQGQCNVVQEMLDGDITGIVSTLIDYSINAASEAKFKVECSDETLEKLLEAWLESINININGIPTGLQELAKEYYKERWAGSSLCLLKVGAWKKITVGTTTITVPTVLWFVNGASVYIKRTDAKSFKLGSDKYFLDESMKKENQLPGPNENIVVQKPFGRWFIQYPTPYLIKKGVYKNWKGLEVLGSKSDEVISKVLPYLFMMEKGDKDAFLQKGITYDDKELQTMADNFKTAVERYNQEKGKTPLAAVPYDQKYSHLIPDLKNILNEELYRQGYRSILAGLGFIDMLEIAMSRQETRMNPKAFVAEVNAGIGGFKSILMDVINLIITENKLDHKKLFSDNNPLRIVSSPIKINVDLILDMIRSGFDRGVLSIESFIETLGFDFDKEKERRLKELENGDEETFYPHLLQNREDIPDRMELPAKPKNEKNLKNKTGPEKNNFKNAELEEDLIIAPYNSIEELLQKHPKMKKYPEGALKVFIEVFNSILKETGDEARAFAGAWSKLHKWMNRHTGKGEQK